MTGEQRAELLKAVKEGSSEAARAVGHIGENLLDCANKLRSNQSEEVFGSLTDAIDDLGSLIGLIKELGSGLDSLGVSSDKLAIWQRTSGMFEEMLAAFERKDWVMLSDLIQYELHPLLEESGKGLSEINEGLKI